MYNLTTSKFEQINLFAIAVFFSFMFNHSSLHSQAVESVGGGVTTQGKISALAFDSINNKLYAYGNFKNINGVDVNNLAVWDGVNWSSLGYQSDGEIKTMICKNGKVYIGGIFTQINGQTRINIACFDGNNWNALGNGLNGFVEAIEFFQDTLYAAHINPVIGGMTLSKWTGTQWITIPQAINYQIKGLIPTDTSLIVYGVINSVGGIPACGVITYKQNGWSVYSPFPDNYYYVYSAAIFNGNLMAVRENKKLSVRTGSYWSEISSSPNADRVYVWNNKVYLKEYINSGNLADFIRIYESAPNSLVFNLRWQFKKVNYSYYSKLSFIPSQTHFYLGGDFEVPGYPLKLNLLKLNDTDTIGIGNTVHSNWDIGEQDHIYTMFFDSTTQNLYVGGIFRFAGTTLCENIARWDGNNWHALGYGLNGKVRKILTYNNEIYAFGNFSASGNTPLNSMAKWNGTQWLAIGTGANSFVKDAVVHNNLLYIAGGFTQVNGINATYFAKYDGITWTPGAINVLSDSAHRMVVHNGKIYIGGYNFNGLYGPLAKLNQNNQLVVLQNYQLPSRINSMLSFNGDLYFTASTWDYYYLYKWNGAGIQLLGTVLNDICAGSSYALNIQNEVYFSCQNRGMHRWTGNGFAYAADIFPLASENGFSKSFLAGAFSFRYFNQQYHVLNHIISLDFNSGDMQANLLTDTICTNQFAYFQLQTNMTFARYMWHFPGGSPDTAQNAYPVIFYNQPGTYNAYLVYTDFITTDTVYVNVPLTVLACPTSISEHQASGFSVYPNPFMDEIYLSGFSNDNSVEVISLSGQTVYTGKGERHSLKGLESGMYLLRIRSQHSVSTQKLLKL